MTRGQGRLVAGEELVGQPLAGFNDNFLGAGGWIDGEDNAGELRLNHALHNHPIVRDFGSMPFLRQ